MEKLQLTTRTFLLLGAGACLIAACSPAASSSRGGTTGSGAGGSGASDAPMGSECKTPNLTRACSSCGAGFQLCTSELKWSACTCSALTSSGGSGGSANGGGAPGTIPAGNLDQSITFDWPESQSSGGTCEAGRYEGNFDGAYCFSAGFGGGGGGNYGPNFTGIDCGPANDYPIMGLSPGGGPGLVYDLTQSGSGEILMVNGGKFQGTTNGFIPFSADLANGKLDCSSAKFTADIANGMYQYAGQTYLYEGKLTADYDKATHTLTNGVWEVWEPATFNMMGTGFMAATNWGKGTWTTKWVP